MLGPRYVLTSYQKKLFDMDYEKHKKRLNVIQGGRRKINEDKDKEFRQTFSDLQSKHSLFKSVEKISTIDKTNQLLLDKLVKISKNQKPNLYKTVSWSSHPGTLNTNFRKRELEKIALENESMAKRLISQHGSVNIKRLEVDFEKHREFGRNVQKVASPTQSAKLPAIQSPKATESPKKRQKKKSKVPEEKKEDLVAVTHETQSVEGETAPISAEKGQGSVGNISQVPSHTANQEVKEEGHPSVNQVTQRTQKDEAHSQVKSSGELSAAQQDDQEIKEEKDEKKSPSKDSERGTKRSGTMQQNSAKFLGDSKDSASRRTSTQMPNRKPSTVKVEVHPTEADGAKSGRREIESQAAKSEREEEKPESANQIQASNREDQSQREQTPKEAEPAEKNEEQATVKEAQAQGEGEANH